MLHLTVNFTRIHTDTTDGPTTGIDEKDWLFYKFISGMNLPSRATEG
jgi:hypothetical protein